MPELPWEIISYIVSLLDRHTLTQAALINNEWNAASNPRLWSNLRSSALEDNLILQGPFKQGLDRNKRHIRNVSCVWGASLLLSLLSGVLPDLDLSILSCKPGLYASVGDVNPLFLILESSPRLRTLRLSTLPSPIENAERLLLTIARCLPLLSTLDLFADALVFVPPIVVRKFLETCSQELEILSLNITFCQLSFNDEEARMLKEPVPGSKAHPNLKSFTLAIQHNVRQSELVEALVLEGFLSSCPGLETVFDCASVSLPRRSWMVDNLIIFNTVRGVLGDYHFTRLVVNSSSPHLHGDALLAAEVSRYNVPQGGRQVAYRNIHIGVSCYPSMELTSQALTSASKRGLQGLYIADGRKFASNDIQSFLHHGRSLRSLTSPLPPTVMAADVIQSQWACTWITVLSIQIGGIPRPDVEFDALGKRIEAGTPLHSGTLEESRIIQRKVYAQLGVLVSLQQLTLGNSPSSRSFIVGTGEQGPVYYNPLFQTNCLEMSLESGLGLLGGLTALQSLDVSSMAHRIGEDELRWMESRWHSMRELIGLNRKKIDAIWLSLYDPDIETVPCGHKFAIDPLLFQSIPELVQEIVDNLALHDLTRLVRVSKEWYYAYTPHIWRDIKIFATQQQSAFVEPAAQEALIRNRDLVRLFWCRASSSVNPLAAVGNTYGQQPLRLTDICFQTDIYDTEDQEPLFECLIAVLEQCPFLVVLDIPTPPPAGVVVENLLKCIAQSLPHLRRLTLFTEDEPFVLPYAVKEFLETVSTELEYLSMGIEFCHGNSTVNDFSIGSVWVLEGCTNLEVIDNQKHQSAPWESWVWNYPPLIDILESLLGVRWRQFHVGQAASPRSDEGISKAITSIVSSTGVVTSTTSSSSLVQEAWCGINIDKCPSSMTLTNGAILSAVTTQSHGPYVIHVDNSDTMKSADVQMILRQGRSLRCLSSRLPPTILVTDMISSPPWSCRWITYLGIQISGIPRPDIYTDYKNSLAPTLLGVSMKQSRAIQRQVYAQLGQLTFLRTLSLGADSPAAELYVSTDKNRTPVFFDRRLQLNCLEMTLESGLGLLAGLRDLEWLTVANMDHRIGVAELQWMEKSWPSIKEVKGLVRCRNGDKFRGGRTVPSGSIVAPGRACGSKVEVLDCPVNFAIS
ncbi:hypothetical protein KI688_003032 [Linnemannia hyalina]|uniref:F-box domain-containing protein n=1 Tax=Linnemannia hyalina TaxID=64524 RepID=A0A9P7XQG0_9FUNG|nr:hypothetical protein KI688_003032 [Linnemannia hyalina]